MNPRYFLMDAAGDGTGTGGAAGGGTGSGTPSGTPAAGTPASGTPASGTPAATWFDGYDADTKGWVANRGYDKLEAPAALSEAIKGFRNAEKFIGVPVEQVLKLPGKDAKPEDFNAVYDKLGRPADPAKYEVDFGQAADTKFVDFSKGLFHKIGLNNEQAKVAAAGLSEFTKTAIEGQIAAYGQKLAQQEVELKGKWGTGYDQNVGVAKQAIGALGINKEQIDSLEQTMGFSGVMELFHTIGSKVGESPFHGQGESGGFGALSKEAAQSEIGRLKGDVEFTKKIVAGDAEAKAKWDDLHRKAYG